ncbi:MAG: ABC transporter permease subunit [Candidatus Delongbacteria bacterium]|jgi:phosphate transport system permease protein|nr:ABC transporter permease subunit [Candidatus Delongbacteria bacterium]
MIKIDKEIFFKKLITITGRLIIIIILILPVVLIVNSIPMLSENSLITLLFSDWKPLEFNYGLRSFIFTSVITALFSSIIAFILSSLTALYLYFYRERKIGKLLYGCIKIMSGIPTVVYGLAGILLIVPLIRNHTPSSSGLSLLSVIIVMSILIIPTMTVYIINGLDLVQKDTVTAGLSLGADELQLFRYVLLAEAKKYFGIAFILGFSRAVSDTMIALMISGNSFRFPTSVFQSARNVTSHIALLIPGEFSGIEFKAVFLSSVILIFIVVVINYFVIRWEK